MSFNDWSPVPGDNTSVGGVNIGEGMSPSGVNNAIRAVMAEAKAGLPVTFADVATLKLNGQTLAGAIVEAAGVQYFRDAGDSATADGAYDADGRYTIVDAAGQRWKLPASSELDATHVGAVPGTTNSSAAINAAIAALSTVFGGGVLRLPHPEWTANIVGKKGVRLVGIRADTSIARPAGTSVSAETIYPGVTVIRPASGGDVISTSEPDFHVENIFAWAVNRSDDVTPQAGYGFRFLAGGCSTRNCGAEGARFDSFYHRDTTGTHFSHFDTNGRWGPSARSCMAFVNSHGVVVQSSRIRQEQGVYTSSSDSTDGYIGLHIEAESSDRAVYDLQFYDVEVRKDTTSLNHPIVISYHSGGSASPAGTADIGFYNLRLIGSASLVGIRTVSDTGVIRGITVDGLRSDAFTLRNASTDNTVLRDSIFRNIIQTQANLMSQTTLGSGCALENVSRFGGGNVGVPNVDAGTYPSIKNCTGLPDTALGVQARGTMGIGTVSSGILVTKEARAIDITAGTDVLTVGTRGTWIITVAASDASTGAVARSASSIAISVNGDSVIQATETKIVDGSDLTLAWKNASDGAASDADRRTLVVTPGAAASNEWIVQVERFSKYVSTGHATTTWLV